MYALAIERTSQLDASRMTPTNTPISEASTTPISATRSVLRKPMSRARQ